MGNIYGLAIGLAQRLWELIMESDSKATISLIGSKDKCLIHPNKIVRCINEWLQKQWDVQLIHIYCEGNWCANWLVRESLMLNHGLHYWSDPLNSLLNILKDDDEELLCSVLLIFFLVIEGGGGMGSQTPRS